MQELRKIADAGATLVAVTARPKALEESTLGMLRAAGVDLSLLDSIVFSGGKGADKQAKISELLVEHGIDDPSAATLVDDLHTNLHAAAALGVGTIHFRVPDVNESCVRSDDWVQRARDSKTPGHRFELLLSAVCVADDDAEKARVLECARELLPAEKLDAWLEASSGL